jgi:AraC-like DNA-binding protein
MQPKKRSREYTRFWRVPHMDGLELLHATYVTQNFSRHMHECYAFGVVEQGVQAYYYRGDNHTAAPGSIVNCLPGEVHTGHAATETGWTYRMFYLSTDILKAVGTDIAGKQCDFLFFPQTVIQDADLARRLNYLHRTLEASPASRLEHQSRLLTTIAALIIRHADDPPRLSRIGDESEPVRRVRELIDGRFYENVSLDELAAVAHLSPFYLVRVFTNEVGLPPHAYLTQTRVMRACRLLRAGVPIAQAAVDVGFVDQSHLHRHFRRIMGMTPGTYQAQ